MYWLKLDVLEQNTDLPKKISYSDLNFGPGWKNWYGESLSKRHQIVKIKVFWKLDTVSLFKKLSLQSVIPWMSSKKMFLAKFNLFSIYFLHIVNRQNWGSEQNTKQAQLGVPHSGIQVERNWQPNWNCPMSTTHKDALMSLTISANSKGPGLKTMADAVKNSSGGPRS